MEIRDIKKEDINEIVEDELRILKETLGEEYLTSFLSKDIYRLIGIFNKELRGYIGLWFVDENAQILNFYIKEEYQRAGIGQNLWDYALTFLKEKGIKNITLEVRTSNEKAKAFYNKNGFKEVTRRKNYYGNEDAILMLKEVKE